MVTRFGFGGTPFEYVGLRCDDRDGKPVAIITTETPQLVLPQRPERSKAELERLHLERYRFDCLAHTGVVPFEDIMPGSNPPDFQVRFADGHVERWDCAAVALMHRRTNYRLFALLRQKLLIAGERSRFGGVEGCLLTVWFASGNGRPPKRTDDNISEMLAEMIGTFQADKDAIAQLTQGGLPPRIPPGLLTASTPGEEAGFSVTPVAPGALQTEFAQRLGFECSLSVSTQISKDEAQAEFVRVIAKHDKSEIEHLLISIGAPDRDGYRYPAEEILLDLAEGYVPSSLEHLNKITVHRWSDGSSFELLS
jgi:hypothetical protein